MRKIAASLAFILGCAGLAGAQAATLERISVNVLVVPDCRADSADKDGTKVTVHASCTRGTSPLGARLPSLPIPKNATGVTWTYVNTPPGDFAKWTLTYQVNGPRHEE